MGSLRNLRKRLYRTSFKDMKTSKRVFPPGREDFAIDPLGYSSLAHIKWAVACERAGYSIDPAAPATSEHLKNPILWLSQANAMSEAAYAVLMTEQRFESMPLFIRASSESQYCAIALMLVGYSLEICLKGMIIMREGIEGYALVEKKTRHHRLHDLAAFVPDLSKKDNAILIGLTHFITWAGRYPDPGSGREADTEKVFDLAEQHKITAGDVFSLSARIMRHAATITDQL